MQQLIELSNDEKTLFDQVGKALYGESFKEKTREIVGAAPAPRVDEELIYRVAERDMPTHVWAAFQLMRNWGYAIPEKVTEPEEGEVLRVDGSILDLLMEALKRVLEALMGVGDAGSPPVGPSRKARQARQGALLIEHNSRR